MRVAFVSVGDSRDVKTWSGIPHFIMKELRRQVDVVDVISPLSRRIRWLYMPALLVAKLRGRQIQLDRHPLALRSYARQIQRALRGKTYDAIVSTSSVAVAGLRTDIPILFWTDAVLEGMLDYYPGSFTGMSAAERATGHRQEAAAIARARCAAYSSAWAVKTVEEHYDTRGQVKVIEFGANLDIDHGADDVDAWVEQRLSSPLNLLFVGVDWQRKGGSIALAAAEALAARGIPVTLRVAGCASPASPLIENLGFIDKTTQAGQTTLKKLLAEATFFVLPSRSEAAGIVFAEASAFGLPILATDTGGVATYVQNGVNGFALPADATPADYAECIAQTLADPARYRQLSLGGHALYAERLNWAVGVARLLRTLKSTTDPVSRA